MPGPVYMPGHLTLDKKIYAVSQIIAGSLSNHTHLPHGIERNVEAKDVRCIFEAESSEYATKTLNLQEEWEYS